ncbi:Cell division control protein 16 [Zancudomyces culisetae]|nr:Cell division control protein 16 [Zancudomyces culisetae]|eukprot:OMH83302.1 Cell division control protein 16 [Zancudomyces culisetae]
MKSLSAISTRELSLDSKTKRNGLKRYRESSNQTSNNEELERHKLRALTRRVHENWDEVDKSLEELRTLIVTNGGLPIEIAKNASSSTKGTDIKSKNDSNESCVEMEKFSNDKFGIGDSKYGDKEGDEIKQRCPLYATPNLPGVHAGAVLVDEVLSLVDPPLYAHLSSHGITGRIYAFPAVMTISACIPPLNQVLKLWDYFLACGVHLNILCIVALVISIRDLLLTTTNPSSVLRHWPPLNASSLIRKSRFLLSQLPHHILFLLENHLCDFDLACKISAHDPSLNLNILAANTSADNNLLCNYPISSTTPRLTSYTASSNSNLASSVSSTFVAAKRRKMPTNLGLSLTDSTSPFPTQFTHLQNNHQQLHSNLDSITNPSSLANKNNDTGPNTRQRNRIRLDLQNWISNR